MHQKTVGNQIIDGRLGVHLLETHSITVEMF